MNDPQKIACNDYLTLPQDIKEIKSISVDTATSTLTLFASTAAALPRVYVITRPKPIDKLPLQIQIRQHVTVAGKINPTVVWAADVPA